MKKYCSVGLLTLVAFIVGCNPPAGGINVATNSDKGAAANGALRDSYSTGANNAPGAANTAKQDPPTPKGMDLALVPADLKNDAYEYYGLGRVEPIKMSMVQDGSSTPATQSVRLTKVGKTDAEFTVSNEGGFSKIGEVVLKLDIKAFEL